MDRQEMQGKKIASSAMFPNSLEPELLVRDEAVNLPAPDGGPTREPLSPLRESFLRLRRDKRAMVSIGIIALFLLLALVGPPIYQHIGGPYVSAINGVTY